MKRYLLLYVLALALLNGACAGMPGIEKPQYSPWHYTFSVLLAPEKPHDSPQLDIAMSLLRMEYPVKQAGYFNYILYSAAGHEYESRLSYDSAITRDEYKDRIIREQRRNYRRSASEAARSAGENPADYKGYNWRYAETVDIKRNHRQGIVVERNVEIYSGGAHPFQARRYYNLDMGELRQLKADDFFVNFHGEPRLRDIMYEELRKYSKLAPSQPLSEGIFFNNEPELTFNFFITNEGFGLHWDPYQIAPYSEGSIQIILPWKKIRPLMLFSGVELLTKFDIYLFI